MENRQRNGHSQSNVGAKPLASLRPHAAADTEQLNHSKSNRGPSASLTQGAIVQPPSNVYRACEHHIPSSVSTNDRTAAVINAGISSDHGRIPFQCAATPRIFDLTSSRSTGSPPMTPGSAQHGSMQQRINPFAAIGDQFPNGDVAMTAAGQDLDNKFPSTFPGIPHNHPYYSTTPTVAGPPQFRVPDPLDLQLASVDNDYTPGYPLSQSSNFPQDPRGQRIQGLNGEIAGVNSINASSAYTYRRMSHEGSGSGGGSYFGDDQALKQSQSWRPYAGSGAEPSGMMFDHGTHAAPPYFGQTRAFNASISQASPSADTGTSLQSAPSRVPVLDNNAAPFAPVVHGMPLRFSTRTSGNSVSPQQLPPHHTLAGGSLSTVTSSLCSPDYGSPADPPNEDVAFCEPCGKIVSKAKKSSDRKSNLQRHKRLEHNANGKTRLECPDCKETIGRSDNLRRHQERKHRLGS